MRYDPYLPEAVAQAICEAPKYIAEVTVEAFSGQDAVEMYVTLGEIENYDVYLFVRWSPLGEQMTVALTAGRRHLRRLDTDDHHGKQPHLHFFDGTREMHTDVRAIPDAWNHGDNLAQLLRDFAVSVNVAISEITFTHDSSACFSSEL